MMEIRLATESDVTDVLLLEREMATAPHWAAAEYLAMVRDRDAGSKHAGRNGVEVSAGEARDEPANRSVSRCLYVAVDGGTLRGFAVGKAILLGQATGTPVVEAELESVAVQGSEQRQGVGSGLCRAVMEWSRRQGATSIGLEVRASSAGAVKLYGGLGFVAAGRRPRYYRDPEEDGVLMHCHLRKGVTMERARGPEVECASDTAVRVGSGWLDV